MALHRIFPLFVRFLAAWIAVAGLMASEHHGTVKSAGLPVPGATVTATNGEQRQVTTTDENGKYSFADLKDGVWKIEVEMIGFAKLSNDVGIAFDSPAAEWNLKFLPLAEIVAPPATQAAPTPTSAAPSTAAAEPGKTPPEPAAPAAKPASSAPPATAANNNTSASPNGNGGRGGRAQNGANGSRPSLTQAMNNYQRADVSASGDLSAAGDAGNLGAGEAADLNGSADPSLMVNGSLSRGLDGPQQNDWFGGPGGRPDGMGPMGMGLGPGGGAGMNTFANGAGDGAGGGRSGPGGGRGGPGFGGPGGPGGPGGFGGRGGPGGFAGGFGGGRGGRGGQAGQGGRGGRAGVASFGNARRDRRMQYNANVAVSLDNSVWDASPYSVNGQETPKPAYAKIRSTMMVGGPLKIPHLLDGRKGTFTFNYQLARTRNGNTTTQTFPTLLERSGDFSQSIGAQGPVTIYDPLTGSPFPGNIIPNNRISPIALSLLQYYPAPNAPGYKYNYQSAIVTTQNTDNINARLNQTLNSKNRLSGGIGYMGNNSTTPNVFNFIDTGSGRNLNASIMYTHNFTSRIINNLRYTFSRSRSTVSPYFAYNQNVAAELGINGTSQDPANWGPPNLSFTNYGGLSDSNSSLVRNQTSSAGDSLIWVKGVHNITVGIDFRRQQFNRDSDPNGRGTYTFTGIATSNSVTGVPAAGAGFDFADFLLGLPATSALRYGNGDLYFRSSYWDAYFTDDWRISTKFSLNAGFRWDYATPINELYNRMVNLDVAPGFASITQVLPGQSGPYSGTLPTSLVRPDRNNFSPRIGFAFRPGTKRNIVIRGGYGIYYNSSVYTTIANNMAQQPPFANTLSVATSIAAPLTLANGFLIPPNNPVTNTYAIDPNYRTGYAQIWQLAVQSDLGHSLVGTITYNGTKGTRLDQTILPNSAPSGAKALPWPSGYIYEMSNGDSIYHGISAQLMRRFRNGISANAIYTYSKAIDNAVQAQNFLDTAAERALSATNRTHVANFNWQYSTGVGRAGGTLVNGWKGALLKDWTFTNAISVGSGRPLTPTVGGVRATTTGTGITGAQRADATGLSADAALPGQTFNYAAFAIPALGQWGNAGRDTITGPMTFSLNASLGRVFRIGERHSIDLRYDITNALNHVTFSTYNTVVGSNNLGLVSGPSAMRSMTATIRFRW
ncbi:MAG TPA: carboxypeptidase-like regulatory domain-containing protein [Candidatus Acidoferrales bacterium]|nr:carboxypeptidase-like regulatory domain-containing protein [Candidatus Acidoferrales bacterium]